MMNRLAPWWILVLGLTVAACGGSGAGSVDIDPGPMPDGGNFTGVWFSPQYGEMHLVQQGSNVVGEYTKDERQGRIQGTVQGNILRFEWSEEREMVAGVPQTTRGRGVFQYVIDDSGTHNVVGEWGIDDNETGGGPWNAYKMENRQPELGSTTSGGESPPGDDLGGDDLGGGDDWDEGGGGGDDFGGDEPEDPALDDLGGLDL